jgi:hypothetical protein
LVFTKLGDLKWEEKPIARPIGRKNERIEQK